MGKTGAGNELYAKRIKVIEFYQSGMSRTKIVEATGLTWPTVNTAIKKYEAGGLDSLMPAQRGRKQGTGRVLTEGQENEMITLFRKRPWQVRSMKPVWNYQHHLWNRDVVAEMIKHIYGITLSKRGVAQYLTRWGFPLIQKSPMAWHSKEVRVWLDEHLSALKERARKENASIYWLGRITIKPIEADRTMQKQSMATMISAKGRVYWVLFKGKYTKDSEVSFLKAIAYEFKRRKLFLIRDNMKRYESYEAYDVLSKNYGRIEIFPPIASKWQKGVFQ